MAEVKFILLSNNKKPQQWFSSLESKKIHALHAILGIRKVPQLAVVGTKIMPCGLFMPTYDDLPPAHHANVDVKDAPFNRHRGEQPALSEQEIKNVVAFLKTLTGDFQPATSTAARASLARERAAAKRKRFIEECGMTLLRPSGRWRSKRKIVQRLGRLGRWENIGRDRQKCR